MLEAELARVRAERDHADSAAGILSDAASEWKRRAEAAEARAGELERELHKIKNADNGY